MPVFAVTRPELLFVFRRKLAGVSVRVVLVTADQREWRFVS